MQHIEIKSPHGIIVDAVAELHDALSTNPLPKFIDSAPRHSERLLELIYYYAERPVVVGSYREEYPALFSVGPPPNPDSVVVCFSGGKDSIATALKLRAIGRSVTLLHIAGINRYATHEASISRALAVEMKMPLVVANVTITGKSEWAENPLRNVMILALAADYGSEHGASAYALGDHKADTIESVNTDCGLSDAVDVIDAGAAMLSHYYAPMSVWHLLDNYTDAHLTLLNLGTRRMRELASACNMPARFKKAHINATKRLFPKIDLIAGRCGVCYKCAAEWLTLALVGSERWDPEYALRCVDIMFRQYNKRVLGEGRKASLEDAVHFFIDPKVVPDIEPLLDKYFCEWGK